MAFFNAAEDKNEEGPTPDQDQKEDRQKQAGEMTKQIARQQIMSAARNIGGLLNGWPDIRDGISGVAAVVVAVVDEIDDEKWAAIVKESHEPCSKPGCGCHKWTGRLMDELNHARDYVINLRKEGRL